MKTSILLLALVWIQGMQSQELQRQMLASAGNSQTVTSAAGTYFIQQSIGQHSVIGTFPVDNNELRQGYIQALPAIVLGGDPNVLEVVVYPNPFTNGVIVNLEQQLEEAIAMELFDISGRLIRYEDFDASTQLTIPLLGLPQGSYFLRLRSGTQQTVAQLIKR